MSKPRMNRRQRKFFNLAMKAYAQTGLVPEAGCFFSISLQDGDICSACAVGAVAMLVPPGSPNPGYSNSATATRDFPLAAKLASGETDDFLGGVTFGFDGEIVECSESVDYDQGYQVGHWIRNACIEMLGRDL